MDMASSTQVPLYEYTVFDPVENAAVQTLEQ
jgi:hypothetical protein